MSRENPQRKKVDMVAAVLILRSIWILRRPCKTASVDADADDSDEDDGVCSK